ncbi:zincin-like metallopeptidase domain-containing protein [Arthrobacter sp. TPD3018]|uniref:zincin-like metallopeptidase domain-containing protein n=1 Tax=Bacteria TaxID=2 RepID=UPI002570D61C|nr:zincin-like metallopeptidase domain-containing protein [Arthrobacter sp. TPD3018]
MRAGYQIGDNCNSDVGGEPDALKGASPVRRGAEGRSQRDATRPTLRLPVYYYPVAAPPEPRVESVHRAAIDGFFDALPATVRHGGDQAFFSPIGDYIQMPHRTMFRSDDHYASTLGHEYVHYSGAQSRLNREFGKKFGDQAYAFEELVASIGQCLICADLGLPGELHDNHASYIDHWLRILKGDSSAIIKAASKAEQAVAWLRDAADEGSQARNMQALAA